MNTIDRKRLGAILRKARRLQNLTVGDAAALAGTSATLLTKVEMGQAQIKLESFLALCAGLGISAGLVITDARPHQPTSA